MRNILYIFFSSFSSFSSFSFQKEISPSLEKIFRNNEFFNLLSNFENSLKTKKLRRLAPQSWKELSKPKYESEEKYKEYILNSYLNDRSINIDNLAGVKYFLHLNAKFHPFNFTLIYKYGKKEKYVFKFLTNKYPIPEIIINDILSAIIYSKDLNTLKFLYFKNTKVKQFIIKFKYDMIYQSERKEALNILRFLFKEISNNEEQNKLLMKAFRDEDYDVIKNILKYGIDIHKNENQRKILDIFFNCCLDLKMLKFLVDQRFDLETHFQEISNLVNKRSYIGLREKKELLEYLDIFINSIDSSEEFLLKNNPYAVLRERNI